MLLPTGGLGIFRPGGRNGISSPARLHPYRGKPLLKIPLKSQSIPPFNLGRHQEQGGDSDNGQRARGL